VEFGDHIPAERQTIGVDGSDRHIHMVLHNTGSVLGVSVEIRGQFEHIDNCTLI
jgi:hypothetical protein